MDRYDRIVERERFDRLAEVEKFNPYHGSDGRFTTADGATMFTYKPGQGKMYDMAIAREQKRHEESLKRYRSVKGDPKTIAGVGCGEPMSREQANEGHVNPNYGKKNGYSINCQSCVVAYEARLRGYDVQAREKTNLNGVMDKLSRNTDLAWIDPNTGETANRMTSDKVRNARSCKAWMEETIQQGERYTFRNGWQGRHSGHIVSADRDDGGQLRLYDPQSGKTYQGSGIDDYLSDASYRRGGRPLVWMMRVDNKAISAEMADGIMEAAR